MTPFLELILNSEELIELLLVFRDNISQLCKLLGELLVLGRISDLIDI